MTEVSFVGITELLAAHAITARIDGTVAYSTLQNPPSQVVDLAAARVERHPILGGLISEYAQAA